MLAITVRALLCVVLLVSLAWADINSPKLSDAEYEQYIEASSNFKTAEKDINSTYKELISALTNEAEKNVLREEQREWIKTRDTKAFSEGQKGSQIYIDALVTLTIQRKTELESMLQNLAQKPAATDVAPLPQPAEKQNIRQQAESPAQSSQQASNAGKNETAKYIIISLLLISAISVFLHFSGKLVLYKDYTDAAVTIGSVVGSLVLLLVCRNILDLSATVSQTITLLFFSAIFIFVFRMTYVTNNNVVFALLSLLTKYTTTCLYAILMLGLMFSGSSKRKGESSLVYELRRQEEEAQNKRWMALITAIFIWFVHATTKIREWSPVGNYVSFSFKKLNIDELVTASDNKRLESE